MYVLNLGILVSSFCDKIATRRNSGEEKAYLFPLSLLCLSLREVGATTQELEADTIGEDAFYWNECRLVLS